ncbi:hypothetical protein AOCH_005148, partial [Aspergillus ochraceoroseus]
MHLRHFTASQLLVGATALSVPLKPRADSQGSTISLHATLYGSRFNVKTTVGQDELELLVDTGSSDLFVVEENFQCVTQNSTGQLYDIAQSFCGFADAYYSPNSSTYQSISDEVFEATYGAGVARGVMAYEDITLGNITVKRQEFGAVNWASPMSLGVSGVLGLAYPPITSAYELNRTLDDDDLSTQGQSQPYNPLFVNMYQRSQVQSYFSLALNRLSASVAEGDGGYMTLGGLPPVKLGSNLTTVAAEFYEAVALLSSTGQRLRSYWAITNQGIAWGDHHQNTTAYQTIIDSGSPLISVPESVATAYNALFSSPAASWDSTQGAYVVDCNATAPAFSVTIGGQTFALDKSDLVIQTGEDFCLSAIVPGITIDVGNGTSTPALHILGAPFLKNVVAVFDFGNHEMKFAARASEETTSGTSLAAVTMGSSSALVALIAA